jgi:hypothetical protein
MGSEWLSRLPRTRFADRMSNAWVECCYLHQNTAFSGVFTQVLAKHSKSFNLIDTLAIAF